MMTIGEKIHILRTQNGMTQEQLAEKMGVSRQAISKWESDVSVPELGKLKPLANLFHVTVDELMGEEVKKEIEQPRKREEKNKVVEYILSLAIILLAFALIIQGSSIGNIKQDIASLQRENERLTSLITSAPVEQEESLFQEIDYNIGEITEKSNGFLFTFWCIPKNYSEETKIMLTMDATNGEVYHLELEEESGIFKGAMEMPVCAVDKALLIQENKGVRNVEMIYSLFDVVADVYPDLYIRMPLKEKIEEIELSLLNEENESQEDNKKRITSITLQICEGNNVDTVNPTILWEAPLTKEEVEKVNEEHKIIVPVEMEIEQLPEFVYIRVVFEHELLEGEQVGTSVEIGTDEQGIAVVDLYYSASSFYLGR